MKRIQVKALFFALMASMFLSSNLSAQCNTQRSTHPDQQGQNWRSTRTSNFQRTQSQSHEKDLVQLAASYKDLSTLVAAVKAAGLVETLKGKGPFTIFAPTNSAFNALPDGTVASLLKPENKDKLIKVLTYHVVPGRVEANDLSTGKVGSVEGGKINVKVSENSVRVNDAIVIKANRRALNGVVHIIDRVILPPDM